MKNPFKKNTPNEKTAQKNERIIHSIVDFIDVEVEKNTKLIETKSPGFQEAVKKINFIREIYKLVNQK